MILENETLEKYGYTSNSLSKGSYKLVVVQCDYCGCVQDKKFGIRNNGNKELNKDACKKCGPKKRNESLIIKYGTKCTLQLDDIKEKRRKTWNKKYGVDHPFANKNIQNKIKTTMIDRYGVDNASKNPASIQKFKNTCLSKYGVDNPAKLDEVKAKISKFHTKDFIDGKTSREIAESIGIAYSSFRERVQKYGLELAISKEKYISSIEAIVRDWLESNDIKYSNQYRVDNKIADFLLTQYNIIIEVDGLYWHSDANIHDNNYHVKKRNLYIKYNYTPLFFREDEILNKFNIVQSIILNKINRSQRIFARKCMVGEIDKQAAKCFLEENHLMGAGRGNSLALYYDSSPIMIMQVYRQKNNNYELARLCAKTGYQVVGGFSRLLKHFEEKFQPKQFKTFIDLRYGEGSYLSDFGFTHVNTSKSFVWTDTKRCFHRMKFSGNKGYNFGLLKLWDCGQAAYLKQY